MVEYKLSVINEIAKKFIDKKLDDIQRIKAERDKIKVNLTKLNVESIVFYKAKKAKENTISIERVIENMKKNIAKDLDSLKYF